MVEPVAELVALGLQVVPVLGIGRRLDRNLLDHTKPEPLEPRDLLRVVREDPDRRQPEVGEDLVPDAPVPRIRWEPELEVRLDGVEAPLLELVGLELAEQADPASLLGHVEEDTALLGADALERLLELLAAVAAQRMEDIAGQALGVDADEDVLPS